MKCSKDPLCMCVVCCSKGSYPKNKITVKYKKPAYMKDANKPRAVYKTNYAFAKIIFFFDTANFTVVVKSKKQSGINDMINAKRILEEMLSIEEQGVR